MGKEASAAAVAAEERAVEQESPATEPTTAADVGSAAENPSSSIDDIIGHLTIPREKVERPRFIDGTTLGADFGDPGDEEAENEVPGEPVTDDDEANQEYLNYSDEHKTTATFLIMTIDRAVAFGCGLAAGSKADKWRQFETKASISEDYLDVTAALVKKYQARMSLELIFLVTAAAIYAPQVTAAVHEGKAKAQAQQKNAA